MTLLPFILLLLLPPPQPAQPSSPTEEARVDYVVVEVVARDSQRRLVTDLSIADFSVRDHGQKVKLESLDLLDLRRSPAAAPSTDRTVLPPSAVPRLRRAQVILALDFEFTRYDEAMETFDQLESYVGATEVVDGLEYLVFSLEGGTLTDGFTPDLRGALPALAEYRAAYEARRLGDEGIGEGDLSELEHQFLICKEFAPDPPYRTALWNCIQEKLAIFLEGQYARTVTVFRDLEELISRFPDPGGLRTIAFISPGFSIRPGRAAVRLSQIYFPWNQPAPVIDPRLTPDPSGAPTALPPPSLESLTDEFFSLLAVCARNHVVFQTFDPYHLGMEKQRRVSAHLGPGSNAVLAQEAYELFRTEVDEGMRELAVATGGDFHGGSSLKHMRPVLEGDRFVYVLGYVAPEGKIGKFRKIKVKCKRGGVKLQHRSGYFR